MMERPLFPADGESAAPDGALHTPAWSELTARLAAARDLRASFAHTRQRAGGGFSRFCATASQPVNAWPGSVNPTGSVHGKDVAAILSPPDMGSPVQADREMK